MKKRVAAAALMLVIPAVAGAQPQDYSLLGQKGRGHPTAAPSYVQRPTNDGLPLESFSKFANRPPVENASATRGAKDASIYHRISPSVVLIMVKHGQESGLGSGTLINANGDILTNWHVVRGATEVGVAFKPAQEGEKITPSDVANGEVVRVDEVKDLALVRVKLIPPGRQPVKLGTQNEIDVGLDVFAIGHPEGEEWTYTKGIISQYRQAYEWTYADKSKHKADLIQTQTPINPGNSGGPLLSESGSLIGVNSFKSDGAEGLNFAVALDEVDAFLAGKSGHPPTKEGVQVASAGPWGKCEMKMIEEGRNKENTGSYKAFDTKCDGKIGAVLKIPDDKAQRITFIVDRNADGKPDCWIVDYNRDTKWDVSFWDTKFDGHIDTVGLHPDGNIEPASYMSLAAYKAQNANKGMDAPAQ